MKTDSGSDTKKTTKKPAKAKYRTSEAIATLRREKYRKAPIAFKEQEMEAAKVLCRAIAHAVEAARYGTVRKEGENTVIEHIAESEAKVYLSPSELGPQLQVRLTGPLRAVAGPAIEYDPASDKFIVKAADSAKDPAPSSASAVQRDALAVLIDAIIAAANSR